MTWMMGKNIIEENWSDTILIVCFYSWYENGSGFPQAGENLDGFKKFTVALNKRLIFTHKLDNFLD